MVARSILPQFVCWEVELKVDGSRRKKNGKGEKETENAAAILLGDIPVKRG